MTKEKAIKTLEIIKYVIVWEDYPIFYQLALDMAIETLKQQNCEDCISREWLKTVIPQPNTGKWEVDEDHIYTCNQCNKKNLWHSLYCPNCGAKMQEVGK